MSTYKEKRHSRVICYLVGDLNSQNNIPEQGGSCVGEKLNAGNRKNKAKGATDLGVMKGKGLTQLESDSDLYNLHIEDTSEDLLSTITGSNIICVQPARVSRSKVVERAVLNSK